MSNKPADKTVYRIIFANQGSVYEIYARNVSHGNFFGFIEVEELIFGEKSQVILDPAEDALKKEFEHTKRTYIPIHSVIRIDEQLKNSRLKFRVAPLEGGSSGNGSAKEGGSGSSTGSKITPLYTPSNPFL